MPHGDLKKPSAANVPRQVGAPGGIARGRGHAAWTRAHSSKNQTQAIVDIMRVPGSFRGAVMTLLPADVPMGVDPAEALRVLQALDARLERPKASDAATRALAGFELVRPGRVLLREGTLNKVGGARRRRRDVPVCLRACAACDVPAPLHVAHRGRACV